MMFQLYTKNLDLLQDMWSHPNGCGVCAAHGCDRLLALPCQSHSDEVYCPICFTRIYCRQECQRADWIRGHAHECDSRQATRNLEIQLVAKQMSLLNEAILPHPDAHLLHSILIRFVYHDL